MKRDGGRHPSHRRRAEAPPEHKPRWWGLLRSQQVGRLSSVVPVAQPQVLVLWDSLPHLPVSADAPLSAAEAPVSFTALSSTENPGS